MDGVITMTDGSRDDASQEGSMTISLRYTGLREELKS
jgi:hypothetical protein